MLVLSRRPGTSILVGHDVTVTVELVAGDDVCLRISGPDSVVVERVEEQQVRDGLEARGKSWEAGAMFVLSRRPRPAVRINGEVVVAVQAISNDSVRIGIQAPPHVLIYREEVYQQMQEANLSAAGGNEDDLAGLASLFPSRPQ